MRKSMTRLLARLGWKGKVQEGIDTADNKYGAVEDKSPV